MVNLSRILDNCNTQHEIAPRHAPFIVNFIFKDSFCIVCRACTMIASAISIGFKNIACANGLLIGDLNFIIFIRRFNFLHNNSLSSNFSFSIIKISLSFEFVGVSSIRNASFFQSLCFYLCAFCVDKKNGSGSTLLSLFSSHYLHPYWINHFLAPNLR